MALTGTSMKVNFRLSYLTLSPDALAAARRAPGESDQSRLVQFSRPAFTHEKKVQKVDKVGRKRGTEDKGDDDELDIKARPQPQRHSPPLATSCYRRPADLFRRSVVRPMIKCSVCSYQPISLSPIVLSVYQSTSQRVNVTIWSGDLESSLSQSHSRMNSSVCGKVETYSLLILRFGRFAPCARPRGTSSGEAGESPRGAAWSPAAAWSPDLSDTSSV